MRWYSDFPGHRARQLTADIGAGVGIVVSIGIGAVVGGLIAALGEIGRIVAAAGGGMRDGMREFTDALLGIPIIGEHVSAPFAGVGEAGASMVAAGEGLAHTVGVVAVLVGLALALVPITGIALLWPVFRVRPMRRAARLRSLVRADGTIDVEGFVDLELRKAGVRR